MSNKMTTPRLPRSPWNPRMVFYNNETADIYQPNTQYELLVNDLNFVGMQCTTQLEGISPELKDLLEPLVDQLQGMMKDSLNHYKSELNG